MTRQLMQQGVGLRLAQFQVLEEVEQETNFVEREADDIHLVGDGDDDLHTEFTAAEYAGDLAILVLRAAINAVGNQHGPAIFQPPHWSSMGQRTVALGDVVGIDILGPFRLSDLVCGANPATSPFGFAFAALLASGILALLFLAQGKR